jgi:hypothetical protein
MKIKPISTSILIATALLLASFIIIEGCRTTQPTELETSVESVGTIMGRVTDVDGRPIAGMRVSIVSGTTGFPEILALTDENGRYTIGSVPAGRFEVAVHDTEGNDIDSGSVTVRIGETAILNFTVTPTIVETPEPTLTQKGYPLLTPILTGNSVELCLNSRYSDHSLTGVASTQQVSNILWGAGRAPITGAYRDIYVSTSTATFLYDLMSHSLIWHSDDVTPEGAFQISYSSDLVFDTGISYMPALLASVSLWESEESPVASCPKGTTLLFGVQGVEGLTSELVAHSSVSEGEPGWLPDPSTTGDNNLEEVLANLKLNSNFTQTDLTLQQISQILWAGYGCTPHITSNNRMGLTVPSANADYFLTETIYIVNESGVFRYHNRNPSTDLTTRDHRIEQINSIDVRSSLKSTLTGLPQAPCYVILCLDYTYIQSRADFYNYKVARIEEWAQLETGFVASNMLIQASAMDLGCHFKTELTSSEESSIQNVTGIPSSHIPYVIVSIGNIGE